MLGCEWSFKCPAIGIDVGTTSRPSRIEGPGEDVAAGVVTVLSLARKLEALEIRPQLGALGSTLIAIVG